MQLFRWKKLMRLNKKQIVSNMLGVYFLNRRMTVMKQIRKHLKLIKILHESIPVIRNLIKSGTNFNTVMELIEKCFRLIDEKLKPIHVAYLLKGKIEEAEGKSKKKIEEEFKQWLEANFNSNIQFNSWSGDKEVQGQIIDFLKGDFREEILQLTNFSSIYESWSFYLLNDNKNFFMKFKFLMQNLLKLGKGDEIITQVRRTFNNNSKRFYHLMLDSLMSNMIIKNANIGDKKEVFKFLDFEDILPSFFLLYFIFSGIYISLDRLALIFFQLWDGFINEDIAIDLDDGTKSQKSQGHLDVNVDLASEGNKTANLKQADLFEKDREINIKKRKIEIKLYKEEMKEIIKETGDYFIKKFIKSLQKAQSKISNFNIEEIKILKHYFDDLSSILKNKYEINTLSIEKAFYNVILEYLSSFSLKRNEATETILKHEQWKTVQISSYFQGIIRVTNDLQISDEEFSNFDKQDSQEFTDSLIIDGK